MVGGNLQFNYSNPESATGDWEFVDAHFAPKFGYYFNDQTSMGIELGLSYTKQRDWDGYGYREGTMLQASVFYRSQNSITEKFKYYIEPSAGRIFIKDSELLYYYVSANVGLMYYVKDRLSIELKVASLDYNLYWFKDSEYKTKEFGIAYDLITPNLGLRYYF